MSNGSISTYGYETLNRITGLEKLSRPGSFGCGYDDALSRRTQLTRPNGITTNYNYDSLSHLLSVLHQAGTTTLDGASYTYDPAGNRTSKGNYLNGVTSNYTYDPLYELTQVTQGGSTTETYSYDFVGNRLSSSGVPNYNYNSSNELTSNSSGSYMYDASGNTLSDAQGRSYTWDFENRLTQVVNPGVGTTTFKYDPFGRRIQKSGPLGTTNYLYEGASLLEEADNSGNVLARYTQGAGIDEPFAELRSATISYYHPDGLGSVTSLANSAGTIAGSYTFDSFGNLTASTGVVTNAFRYTAREYDAEVGLYYYRARYYDAGVGRFIGEDPMQFGASLNFYTYVDNDPVNFLDPSGRLAELYCETIPLFTGGIVRASEKLILGVGFGYRPEHCFLRIACSGKDRFFELSGPSAEYRGGKYGRPEINPFNRSRADSWSTEKVPIIEPSGTHCCEFEKRLEDSFAKQVGELPPYSIYGPNSNTFILNVITGAGGSANLPFLAKH